MHPVLFEIGPLTVHSYGVFFAAGFLATAVHWSLNAKRVGMPALFGVELCIWVMVAGVVGARTAYVLANWSFFWDEPARIFRVDRGGLVYYGGMIGAFLGGTILARRHHIPFWRMTDYGICAIPLGHAIGRVGCLLNGCCFGSPSESWWAVPLEGIRRHPTQIAEATGNLAIYILLYQLYKTKHRDGRVLAAYLVLYPLLRFALEFVRGDERLAGVALNVAQEISLLFIAAGVLLWFTLPRKRVYGRHVAS